MSDIKLQTTREDAERWLEAYEFIGDKKMNDLARDAVSAHAMEGEIYQLRDDLKDARFTNAEGDRIIAKQRAAIAELESKLESVAAERDKLAKFKSFVHERLDAAGVEKNPVGKHAAEGCRVGERLRVVFEERDRLKTALEAVIELDQSKYKHHQKRPDGKLPRSNGGSCWMTPKQVAHAALAAHAAGKDATKGESC